MKNKFYKEVSSKMFLKKAFVLIYCNVFFFNFSVVQQTFIPQVYDDYVIRGNTAVLRCHLPSFVREYVTLDSWLIDDDVVIKSTDIQSKWIEL